MNWILKNKKKNSKTLLVVLFLAFNTFYFSINNAKAVTTAEQQAVFDKANATAAAGGSAITSLPVLDPNNKSPQGTSTVVPGKDVNSVLPLDYRPPVVKLCAAMDFTCYFKELLVGILNLVGFLFGIAATLFAWIINPANVSGANGMLNKQAVKDVWIMVRDLLNMTFILVLLFAAFCTIFQVDKWNLKKVWLNVLINALLVNFSFPIARFFIDVSNVAFYYFVEHLFSPSGTTAVSGGSIFASFGASSNIGNLLTPGNYTEYSVAYLIAMIIVVFIMGMTLMVIAALFVVRLIALTMIVMFSPVGFVGYIFPSTSKYADKWWSNLFSYSFFAPIMIFIMAIALRITTAMGQENMQGFITQAQSNATAKDASWIANAAFLAIPIIILWMGIGIAKSMSIAGAAEVTGKVKGWGKTFANGAQWAAFKNPIARGIKEGVKEKSRYNKLEKWWKDPSNLESAVKGGIVNAGRDDGIIGGATKAWNKTRDKTIADENKKKIAEGTQDHVDTGASAESLSATLNSHATKKDDLIKHAAASSAYIRLDGDEKRAHIDKAVSSTTAGNYGEFQHLFTAGPHPSLSATEQTAFNDQLNEAKNAANNMKTHPLGGTKQDKQTVAAFINKQLKANISRGVKAK